MNPVPPPLPRRMSPLKKMGLWFAGIVSLIVISKLPPPPSSSLPTTTTAAEDGAALAARDRVRGQTDPSICLSPPDYKAVSEGYSTVITGVIKNTCGRNFRYVQVTFKLFDNSGAVVGTALANQNNLDNGETWKFKAHAFTDFAKFRLDKITAF